MAPEFYDENYGIRVDIYAFGMCVLEMITEETPYKECENPAQVYKKVIEGIKPKALDKIQDIEAKEFIENCIQHSSYRPSASELLNCDFLKITDEEIENHPV